ncbi:MAG: S41 family peptidase [Polyangiaceae bacterium]
MKKKILFAFGAALSVLAPTKAWAITFDAAGDLSFDPKAIVSEGFETIPAQDGLTIVSASATTTALEGKKFANVSTTQSTVTIPVTLPKSDGSYRARFFARTNRVVASIELTYAADGAFPDASIMFFPTGRVTSDGWYEVETSAFSVQSARITTVALSIFASGADIDAFELVADGTYRAPTACTIARDPVCNSNEYCAAGWCQDGEYQLPPLPAPQFRNEIVTWFQERFELFFGGVYSRANRLATAVGTLETMRNATNGWTFWDGFGTGLHKLHDWHTTLDGPVGVSGRGAFPICFVEGTADISQTGAPSDPVLADVIVSDVGPDQNSGLNPGDRLVAVDGVHPIAWAESLDDLDWGAWKADDPGTHAEAIERMRNLIRRFAKEITIVKCSPNGGTPTCAAPVTIEVADLPRTEPATYPTCDHRPAYHLATGNPDPITHAMTGVYSGVLADSNVGENLYGMIWNDVEMNSDGTNPYTTAIESFRANANGVILDHRLGNGGTADAATYLTSLFRPPAQLATYTGTDLTLGLLDQPFSTALGVSLYNTFFSVGGNGYSVGAANARTSLKVALMLARDGSASDWFPYGMKDGGANIKIFGRQTAGAFSSFFQFDYFGGLAWRLASGDLIRADGTSHLGQAVVPDVEMLPKQSDLIVGKDTVYEAALAWIRE